MGRKSGKGAAMVQVRKRTPTRRLFTLRELERMEAAEILAPDERIELIEGEIIQMPPIGEYHAGVVAILTRLFSKLGDRSVFWGQSPLRLDDESLPQPDVALLRPRDDFYTQHRPEARDVLLLIEVSDTTVAFDRGRKQPLYAQHGIQEYWLVNLRAQTIEVYRDPAEERYATTQVFRRGQHLSPAAFPDLEITVDTVLG